MDFKYRYETLLSYRNHLKEKAEIDLGRAQQRLRLNIQQFEEIEHEVQALNKEMAAGLKKSISSDELLNFNELITTTEFRAMRQQHEVSKAQNIVSEKKKILIEKTKEYKVIEKLREKDLKQWEYQKQIEERKQMDEIAIVRHGRDFL